jgi:mRNA interferase MazF
VTAAGAGSRPVFPRRFPRRGEIYQVDFGDPRGSAQAYERPALIVSNDVNNEHSPTVVVAAITTTLPKRPSSVTVVIPAGALPRESAILCTQLLTLDKQDLLRHRGDLDKVRMREVEAALLKALAIRP